MMGGGAYFNHIKEYSNEKGFRIIAVGNNPEAEYYTRADEAYPIDTMDIEKLIALVNDKKIDGIFTGAQEQNAASTIRVSEQTGARFYATREQWEVFSDKGRFKQRCRTCGIPVVPDFHVDINKESEIESLPFPVLIKPADGSGGHGMNVCYIKEQFVSLYKEALKYSQKKKVIIEKFFQQPDECFFQYTFMDGQCFLTSAFTKVFSYDKDGIRILPLFHVYPSNHIEEYYKYLHDKIISLFKQMDIRHGVMTIQSFFADNQFYVFEAGYRMGGAQNYIFSDYLNGTNSLHTMIDYVLTGKTQTTDKKDDPFFRKPCCNYYIALKPGIIRSMPSKGELTSLPGVLNATVMRKTGDSIEDTNSLDRIAIRLHVIGESVEELADHLVNIYNSIHITTDNNKDMILDELTYPMCYHAIKAAVWNKTVQEA